MTRERFSALTGIGEASLNRWENGINIQTHANDRYLRLLADPNILCSLERLITRITSPASDSEPAGGRFRDLKVTEDLKKEQESFELRKAE